MNVTVRRVTSLADCDVARGIAAVVWGSDAACSTPQMSVHAKHGGVVLLAEVETNPVGFLFSFPALYRGEWVLWSHETAVLPDYMHQGIGLKLKQEQRAIAREMNYREIAWTYDPLIARNAHFNLNKLGAHVVEYEINAYGADEGDLVNQGIETDRLIAVWDVEDEASDAIIEPVVEHVNGPGLTREPDSARNTAANGATLARSSRVALAVGADGGPVPDSTLTDDQSGALIFTEIPRMPSPTHQLRVAWRAAFREAAMKLFARGYAPVSFARSDERGVYAWAPANH